MSLKTQCPNCQSGKPETFFEAYGVPTNSCILLDSEAEARSYPKGDITLGFCGECGFIYNTSMDLSLTEYSGRYEETQGYSPTFSKFHRQLAKDVKEKFQLENKKVLEIGCGKGEFLMLLCEDESIDGIGIDPSYIAARNDKHQQDNVEFISDFYSEKYADIKVDLVCCKMTLEHIPETHQFINMIRNSIGDNIGTRVFFMIPEALRILESCAFEDIYYEHCSYFTPCSLTELFQANGFSVDEVFNLYDDQYLAVSATVVAEPVQKQIDASELNEIKALVADFPNKFEEKKEYWRNEVESRIQADKKIVIWGSGSKGVSFLTTLGLGDQISYAVDINPHRQGFFMPTTGHEIVSPEYLKEFKPDTVIVMNRIYTDEIAELLGTFDLKPEILAL